jgi:hypothetical protein
MAKGQKRGNREIKKPKQKKEAAAAPNPFASLKRSTGAGAEPPAAAGKGSRR